MSVLCLFQQSDTAVTAQKQRYGDLGAATKMFSSGTNSGTRIDGVGGVNPQPSALRVTQTGSPSLAVAVDRGICVVPGIENILQGNYCVVNDTAIASVPLALAPHATLFRKDAIVVRVKDAVYSGALNQAEIVCVTGNTGATAGATTPPSAATIGNSYLELGYVTVRPAATSVLAADIEDRRHWLTAPGGVTSVRTFETSILGIMDGDTRWNPNTKQLETYQLVDALWHGSTPILYTNAPAHGALAIPGTITSFVIPDPGWPYKLQVTGTALGYDSGPPCASDLLIRLDNASTGTIVGMIGKLQNMTTDDFQFPFCSGVVSYSTSLTGSHTVYLRAENKTGTMQVQTTSANQFTQLNVLIIPA